MKSKVLLYSVLACMFLASCDQITPQDGSSADSTPNIESIIQNPVDVEITGLKEVEVGKEISLTARVLPSTAFQGVVFKSSDPLIATVTEDGIVKGIKEGSVDIIATTLKGLISVKTRITVIPPMILPESVEIISDASTMEVGTSLALKSKILPEEVKNKDVTWAVNDEKLATINNGVIQAIAPGDLVVTVSCVSKPSIKDTYEIKIKPQIIHPTRVEIISKSELTVGEEMVVEHKVYGPNGVEQNVNWSIIGDQNLINFLSLGDKDIIVALDSGEFTLVATAIEKDSNGKIVQAQKKIKINEPIVLPTGIVINGPTEVFRHSSIVLNSLVKGPKGVSQQVKWSIKNGQANIKLEADRSKATITGLNMGTATVVAKSVIDDEIVAEHTITVENDIFYPVSINITGENTVKTGETISLSASITGTNEGVSQDVYWYIKRGNGIVTISIKDNVVTVKGETPGTAIIGCRAKDLSEEGKEVIEEFEVTVQKGSVAPLIPETFAKITYSDKQSTNDYNPKELFGNSDYGKIKTITNSVNISKNYNRTLLCMLGCLRYHEDAFVEFDLGETVIRGISFDLRIWSSDDFYNFKRCYKDISIQEWDGEKWVVVSFIDLDKLTYLSWYNYECRVNSSRVRIYGRKKTIKEGNITSTNTGRVCVSNIELKK